MPQIAYYPAQSVDPMLKSASGMMRSLVGCLDQAQMENEALRVELDRVKAASAGRVELEKVASLSPSKVNEFVGMLVDRSLIPNPSDQEKYAAACRKSPDTALEFAMQALRLTESPHSEGAGSTKSASGPAGEREDLAAWSGLMKYLP